MTSGEVMIKELVYAARKSEMETSRNHGVYEKVPVDECWKSTGNPPAVGQVGGRAQS